MDLRWEPLVTDAGKLYIYPVQKRAGRATDIRRPAVYRWAIRREGKRDIYLIGETDSLDRRLGEYLRSRTKHHEGIRARFDKYVKLGAQVGLETLQFTDFAINGVTFSDGQLIDPLVRRMLEALCCTVLNVDGFELLNDTLARRKAKRLNTFTPEEIARWLKAWFKATGYTKESIEDLLRNR
ncbi:MAG TPA: hypothetical protein VMW54_06095 [Terriglobia bacterium]|nr:hypothetical protein [Terriglobia bacterium]